MKGFLSTSNDELMVVMKILGRIHGKVKVEFQLTGVSQIVFG